MRCAALLLSIAMGAAIFAAPTHPMTFAGGVRTPPGKKRRDGR